MPFFIGRAKFTRFNGMTREDEYPRRLVYHQGQFMAFEDWVRINEPQQPAAIIEEEPPKSGSLIRTILDFMLISPLILGFMPAVTILSVTSVFTVLFDKFAPKNEDKGEAANGEDGN